jgi:cytochrome b561
MENKTYSATFRILHAAIGISMLLLLFTIFLRMTWMNKNNMAGIIQHYLSSTDLKLDNNQLIVLAKQIRQPMWQWHIYLGYLLTGLFTIRFLLPFFGEMKFQSPFDKTLGLKEIFQYWVYIVFYIFVTVSLITGLIIKFGPSEIKESVESIHVLSIYYLVTYIVLHFGGIFMAELTEYPGIISKIVSGKPNI